MKGTPKEIRATEAQAIARAVRTGQEKTVTIVRLIVKESVEYDTFIEVYGEDALEEKKETEKEEKGKKGEKGEDEGEEEEKSILKKASPKKENPEKAPPKRKTPTKKGKVGNWMYLSRSEESSVGMAVESESEEEKPVLQRRLSKPMMIKSNSAATLMINTYRGLVLAEESESDDGRKKSEEKDEKADESDDEYDGIMGRMGLKRSGSIADMLVDHSELS